MANLRRAAGKNQVGKCLSRNIAGSSTARNLKQGLDMVPPGNDHTRARLFTCPSLKPAILEHFNAGNEFMLNVFVQHLII